MLNKLRIVPGLLVRIRTYPTRPDFWDYGKRMMTYMGQEVTILKSKPSSATSHPCYSLVEDGDQWYWRDIDFQKVNTPCDFL